MCRTRPRSPAPGTLTPGGQVNPTITQNPTGDVLVWSNIANLVRVQKRRCLFNAIPEPEAAIDPGLTNPHVNEAEAIGKTLPALPPPERAIHGRR